jgi:processive 1,2-diacylglycerol beta-glucosyltransferase
VRGAIDVRHPEESGSMIDVYRNDTNELIGSITDADLQVLVGGLEEETEDDQDYWIDKATIDVLGDGRATEHLLGVLRKALGSSDGVEIRWQRR